MQAFETREKSIERQQSSIAKLASKKSSIAKLASKKIESQQSSILRLARPSLPNLATSSISKLAKRPKIEESSKFSKITVTLPPEPTPLELESPKELFELIKATLAQTITPGNVARSALIVGIATPLLVIASGGSLVTLLPTLSSLGYSAIPGFLTAFLKNAGFTVTSGIGIEALVNKLKKTERGRVILLQKLPENIITKWSEKLGIPLGPNTTYEDLLKTTLSSSTSLYAGGPINFLVSIGISKTITLSAKSADVGKLYAKKASEKLKEIPMKIIEKLADPKVEKVNVLDQVAEEIESLEVEVREEVGKDYDRYLEEISVSEISKTSATIDQSTLDAVAWGRVAALSAGLASAVVATATGTVTTETLKSLGVSASSLIAENKQASTIIFNIISSTGITKISEALGLTKDQASKLAELERSPNPNAIIKFVRILTGGQIHGSKISSYSKDKLLKLAKEKGLKVSESVSLEALRDSVKKAEANELAKLHSVLQTALTGALVSTLGSKISSVAVDLAERPNVVVEGGEVTTRQQARKEELMEFFKETEARLEREVLEAKEAAISKEVEARQTARDLELSEKRLRFEEARARSGRALYRKPIGPIGPKTIGPSETDVRVSQKVARRLLREAALLEQTSLNSNVVIIKPETIDPVTGKVEGPQAVTGLPIDVALLNPDVAEALEKFEFTPLMMALSKKAAIEATSFFDFGIVNKINTALDIADVSKMVYNINKVVTNVQTGTPLEELDWSSLPRIPSLGTALDAVWKIDKTNLKSIVTEGISDQIKKGVDLDRLYTYIGRQVLWGEKASEGLGITDWMVKSIGRTIYEAATSGASSQTVYVPKE